MLNVLGRGSFGAVMMVRYKQDGRIFAIKILKKSAMDATDMQNAMEERQILQRVKHPYVSSLVFAFQTSERLYLGKCPCFLSASLSSSPRCLGMKFYAAGDLFYHLNQKGGGLPLADARLYAAELVLAISYLHSLNILYRDLKHIQGTSHGVKTLSGTAEYVAPEALVQTADGTRDYGKAYDWWSFGIVLSSETDTKYVDPVFTKDGPPSAVYDVAASHGKKDWSKRFSQFSFDFHRDDNSSKK
ncbi:hypothetical protein DYB38_008827 [Aphanomyces astaci]|uniref:non-specific serine/threonine protein kinase n=1 Tax=Aphanomyces astaci TaxID=112090 RepID=A0A397CE24_APHAT|nr:hypothetical protein DYB38_008827 [Aphanomyces astaci]